MAILLCIFYINSFVNILAVLLSAIPEGMIFDINKSILLKNPGITTILFFSIPLIDILATSSAERIINRDSNPCVFILLYVSGLVFTPFGQTTVIETGVFFNSAFKALENLSTNALDAQYTLL